MQTIVFIGLELSIGEDVGRRQRLASAPELAAESGQKVLIIGVAEAHTLLDHPACTASIIGDGQASVQGLTSYRLS
jgi:hypothetical protein